MATAIAPELERKGRAARAAAPALARTPSVVKDQALLRVADTLEAQADRILAANARDLDAGRAGGLSSALMDRLLLDAGRIVSVANGDTPHGSIEYQTIFAVGLLLFVMTLAMNVLGRWVVQRFRQQYE